MFAQDRYVSVGAFHLFGLSGIISMYLLIYYSHNAEILVLHIRTGSSFQCDRPLRCGDSGTARQRHDYQTCA